MTAVQLLLHSLGDYTLEQGMKIGGWCFDIELITLSITFEAAPPLLTCHACGGPGFNGRRVFLALLMLAVYPVA